jgi:hypothetical protein
LHRASHQKSKLQVPLILPAVSKLRQQWRQ